MLDNGKETIIYDFLDYLTNIKMYSKNTIENYEKDLIKYFRFLDSENIVYSKVEYSDLKIYLGTISTLKRSSILRNVSSIRSFYNYLLKKKIVSSNVVNLLEVKNNSRRLPNFNTYETTRNVLDNIDIVNEFSIRDKLIIELLYSTGIRVSELVEIKDVDVNLSENIIKILGKGNKERYVVFGSNCEDLLKQYFKLTIKCKQDAQYLIVNNKGSKITTRSINNIIYKYKLVNTKMSAHTFRHSCATDLLNNGADLVTVQSLLGHSNMATTSIYTHTSKEKIRNDYLKAHPRSKNKEE